jgi:hypothetical protein
VLEGGFAGVLIFVFAGFSCGRSGAILAEFAAVPNVQSAETPAPAAHSKDDVRAAAQNPTPPPTATPAAAQVSAEFGGPKGPEPTRFGDWERNGRCVDF